ncbi:MAG: ABC transporter permease [Ignavibacteria bacterium]|nr:ABC transporter permease [Ignavibacteria bacterium]
MIDFIVIKAITKKEIRQLRREKRMLLIIFIFPLFLLVIFGYAINLDVKHIQLAVLDFDRTRETRTIINSLISSEYFDLVGYINNYKEADKILNTNKAQLVIVFPKGFTKDFFNKNSAKIQFFIDGINGNTSNIIYNYSKLAANFFTFKRLQEIAHLSSKKPIYTVQLEPRFWYNPELKSNIFLVPGLIGIIIILTSAITVSLSIVKEKERNTIEQILISPISPLEFIVGKSFPYMALAFINSILVVVFGHIIFGVPVKGNLLLLTIALIFYIYSSSSIGIFVSIVANNQLVAFLMVVIISVLPSMLLSGFIFPIESMPFVIQLITNLTPAKFFLSIIRGLLLKDVGLSILLLDYIYLICYGTIFIVLSFVVYKRGLRISL